MDASASRAFDRIAPVYDRTRGSLDDVTADALTAVFRQEGSRQILEIGVGTGRIAAPLRRRGLRVIGLDPSRAMLVQARSKGVPDALQGRAEHLPLRDRSVDVAFLAHVLHLLPDPGGALREASRVSRRPVAALVSLRDDRADADGRPREDDLRKALHELLRAEGVDLPPFAPPWRKEQELLRRYPPTTTHPISDRTIAEAAEWRIEGLALRGYRNLLDVPREPLDRAIARLRERFGDRTITVRRVYALARWAEPPRDGPGAPASG